MLRHPSPHHNQGSCRHRSDRRRCRSFPVPVALLVQVVSFLARFVAYLGCFVPLSGRSVPFLAGSGSQNRGSGSLNPFRIIRSLIPSTNSPRDTASSSSASGWLILAACIILFTSSAVTFTDPGCAVVSDAPVFCCEPEYVPFLRAKYSSS